MKIYALNNLLLMKKEECSQVTSIEGAVASEFSSYERPSTAFPKLKENLLNFIFKRQSRYQAICDKLAQVPNLQKFTLHLEVLNALTDEEFNNFNHAFIKFENLHTAGLVINGSVNNQKVRKRLKIFGETLAQITKLKNLKIYYIPKHKWSRATYRLWQDLWLVASNFPNIQNLYFNCDALEDLSVAKWNIVKSYMPKCQKLKHIYLKSKGIRKLSDLKLEALCEGLLAQAQMVQSVHFSADIGHSSMEQRIIIGKALAKMPNLEYLDLSSNNILSDWHSIRKWQGIGGGLRLIVKLKKLNFADNSLGRFGIMQWRNLGHAWSNLPCLEELDLSNNHLGSMSLEQMRAFANVFDGLYALKTLNLSGNFFGNKKPEIWQEFANALEKLQNLENLDLSTISLGELDVDQYQDFGKIFAKLDKLRNLNLSDNKLGHLASEEWQAFLAVLKQMPNLQEINVNYNELTNDRLKQLNAAISPKIQRISFSSNEFGQKMMYRNMQETQYNGLRFNFKPDELVKYDNQKYLVLAKQKMLGFFDKTFAEVIINKNLTLDNANKYLDNTKKILTNLLSTKDICTLEEVCKPKLKPS